MGEKADIDWRVDENPVELCKHTQQNNKKKIRSSLIIINDEKIVYTEKSYDFVRCASLCVCIYSIVPLETC